MDFIEIPRDLKRSNCLEWNTCYDKFNFLYLYIRHLFPETASITDFRQMPIKYLKKFNIKGFTFPLQFCDIKKFLCRNRHLPISISVLYESENHVSNLWFITIKNNDRRENTLRLLMIKHDPKISSDKTLSNSRPKKVNRHKRKKSSCNKIRNSSPDKKSSFPSKFKKIKDLNQQHHFFKITKLQGFLNNRAGLLSNNKAGQQKYIHCEKCLLHFRSKSKREKHERICYDKQRTTYPCKNAAISFSNHKHKFKAPVVGFCDFESGLQGTRNDLNVDFVLN